MGINPNHNFNPINNNNHLQLNEVPPPPNNQPPPTHNLNKRTMVAIIEALQREGIQEADIPAAGLKVHGNFQTVISPNANAWDPNLYQKNPNSPIVLTSHIDSYIASARANPQLSLAEQEKRDAANSQFAFNIQWQIDIPGRANPLYITEKIVTDIPISDGQQGKPDLKPAALAWALTYRNAITSALEGKSLPGRVTIKGKERDETITADKRIAALKNSMPRFKVDKDPAALGTNRVYKAPEKVSIQIDKDTKVYYDFAQAKVNNAAQGVFSGSKAMHARYHQKILVQGDAFNQLDAYRNDHRLNMAPPSEIQLAQFKSQTGVLQEETLKNFSEQLETQSQEKAQEIDALTSQLFPERKVKEFLRTDILRNKDILITEKAASRKDLDQLTHRYNAAKDKFLEAHQDWANAGGDPNVAKLKVKRDKAEQEAIAIGKELTHYMQTAEDAKTRLSDQVIYCKNNVAQLQRNATILQNLYDELLQENPPPQATLTKLDTARITLNNQLQFYQNKVQDTEDLLAYLKNDLKHNLSPLDVHHPDPFKAYENQLIDDKRLFTEERTEAKNLLTQLENGLSQVHRLFKSLYSKLPNPLQFDPLKKQAAFLKNAADHKKLDELTRQFNQAKFQLQLTRTALNHIQNSPPGTEIDPKELQRLNKLEKEQTRQTVKTLKELNEYISDYESAKRAVQAQLDRLEDANVNLRTNFNNLQNLIDQIGGQDLPQAAAFLASLNHDKNQLLDSHNKLVHSTNKQFAFMDRLHSLQPINASAIDQTDYYQTYPDQATANFYQSSHSSTRTSVSSATNSEASDFGTI